MFTLAMWCDNFWLAFAGEALYGLGSGTVVVAMRSVVSKFFLENELTFALVRRRDRTKHMVAVVVLVLVMEDELTFSLMRRLDRAKYLVAVVMVLVLLCVRCLYVDNELTFALLRRLHRAKHLVAAVVVMLVMLVLVVVPSTGVHRTSLLCRGEMLRLSEALGSGGGLPHSCFIVQLLFYVELSFSLD